MTAFSPLNIEYTYFMLTCHERHHGPLSEADRQLALDAVGYGKVLIEYGQELHSPPARVVHYIDRLRELAAKSDGDRNILPTLEGE